jgi:hypothetical protein
MEDWKLVLIVLYVVVCIVIIKKLFTKESFTPSKAPGAPKTTPKKGAAPPKKGAATPKKGAVVSSDSYKVTPTTKTGVRLTKFTAGAQTGSVNVHALTGDVTWKSIALNNSVKGYGRIMTDFPVMPGPNSTQAFQVKGTFSTNSPVPIMLGVPGYFINDRLQEVKTSLFIPANNEKKTFLFNCYVNDNYVKTFYFQFMYAQPVKAGVKNFTVNVGKDITITLIKGNPSPVPKPLYPPGKPDSKYTIKNSSLKKIKREMFLCLDREIETTYSANPSASEAHWFVKPIIGTKNTFNIENVKKPGHFLNSKGDDLVWLWTDPNNWTCQWYMVQVNPGENVYTMQNVHKKNQNQPSFLGTRSGSKWAVFLSSSSSPEAQFNLNLV